MRNPADNLSPQIRTRPEYIPVPGISEGDPSCFAAIFRIRYLGYQEAGIPFSTSGENEPISRIDEHISSLQAALDSPEHAMDRSEMLREVIGPNVLELGSGTGSIVRLIGTHCDNLDLLVGVEFSPHFFEHAANRLTDIPEGPTRPKRIFLIRADITQMSIRPEHFNTIVLSSIVHEIKSYHSAEKVKRLFGKIHGGLKPGGRVVICDGFRRPGAMARLSFTTAVAKERFDAYLRTLIRPFSYTNEGGTIILPTTDAIEFAIKTQFDNWKGEIGEDYYPFTPLEYIQMLKECGFTDIRMETSPEEGDFLEGIRIEDFETGENEAGSHNNVMIVATK